MTELHGRLKQASFKLFVLGDRLGVHILPKHYYTPVPDIHWLVRHRDAWVGPTGFDHIAWDIDGQLVWLREVCEDYYQEVKGWGPYNSVLEASAGPGYGPIESQVLHCVVRRCAPRRIVEIGAGTSTLVMLHAGRLNAHEARPAPNITCIEPFPRPAMRQRTEVKLVVSPLQTVDISVFDQLEAGDLLFIDSSHAVKVGSDLQRIYLEIIPRLAPGVIVHIHDIYFPYLYPRDALRAYFGWQESTLLLGLLTDNPRLRVLGCLSALHYERPDQLRSFLSDYTPQENDEGLAPARSIESGHFPSSIYIVTAGPKDKLGGPAGT